MYPKYVFFDELPSADPETSRILEATAEVVAEKMWPYIEIDGQPHAVINNRREEKEFDQLLEAKIREFEECEEDC